MIRTEEFEVNMGPQHPSTHGVLRLLLKLDGEVVVEATPHIGYLHRSVEKIGENVTYPMFMPFTDRLDYVASMANNWAYALCVEKLMWLKVPEKGEYLRVVMGELNRIASHLLWYGTFALDMGATTPFLWAFQEREKILDLFEMVCGGRLTFNYYRIGGVSQSPPHEFEPACKKFIKEFRERFPDFENILTENIIFLNRTKGVGVIPKDLAVGYSCSGPVLRGSGVDFDLRRDEPYSVYNELEFEVPYRTEGDCWSRYRVRMDEMIQSTRIVEQCLDKMPKNGNVRIPLPSAFTVPSGEAYTRIEAPRGDQGYYIVSNGTEKPWRIKMRPPAFSNLSVVPEIVRGVKVADIVVILGSIDIVLGEVDR